MLWGTTWGSSIGNYKRENTGMYNVDFISIVMGYIVGVGLCYTTMQMIYALEDADDDT